MFVNIVRDFKLYKEGVVNTVNVNQINAIRLPRPLGVSEQVIIKGHHYIDEKIRSVFDKDIGKEANIIEWVIGKESGLVIYKVMVKESGDIKAYFPEDLIFIN